MNKPNTPTDIQVGAVIGTDVVIPEAEIAEAVKATPTTLKRNKTIPSAPYRETKKLKSEPEIVDLTKPELVDLTEEEEKSHSMEGMVEVIDLTNNEELVIGKLIDKLEAAMDEIDKTQAEISALRCTELNIQYK